MCILCTHTDRHTDTKVNREDTLFRFSKFSFNVSSQMVLKLDTNFGKDGKKGFFDIPWLVLDWGKRKENKHNAELQRADPGTKVTG